MEPEGITRACPSVPLVNKNTRTTQAQAIASFLTRVPNGADSTSEVPVRFTAEFFLAFTFHRHFFLQFCRAVLPDLQLHQVRGIDPGIARRAELPFGIIHRLP